MKKDPIVYFDSPGHRVLDLRPDGVSCIPSLRYSEFKAVADSCEEHIHPDCLEVCLCVRGNLTFASGGRIYPFRPGSVFVSTPKEPHHLQDIPKGLKVYSLLFRFCRPGEKMLGLGKRESEWISRSLANLPKRMFAGSSSIADGFSRLFAIYDSERKNSPARRAKMISTAAGLLIAIVEAARKPIVIPSKTIVAISEQMREIPQNDYNSSEMAGKCGLSRSAFLQAFKQATGLPPHSFLLECRIGLASRLLQTTNRSIESIADELRFSSPKHFATVFRKLRGCTPSAFREPLKRNG